jgi:hypothetical protein
MTCYSFPRRPPEQSARASIWTPPFCRDPSVQPLLYFETCSMFGCMWHACTTYEGCPAAGAPGGSRGIILILSLNYSSTPWRQQWGTGCGGWHHSLLHPVCTEQQAEGQKLSRLVCGPCLCADTLCVTACEAALGHEAAAGGGCTDTRWLQTCLVCSRGCCGLARGRWGVGVEQVANTHRLYYWMVWSLGLVQTDGM